MTEANYQEPDVSAPVQRARYWQLRTRRLEFGRRPLLMGVLNVTPDSFSDGGKFLEPQAAVDHAWRLVAEGAEILDIGGESTRPYAQPVPAEEELRRVMPVLESLAGKLPIAISIDTYKAVVAREAIAAGAEIINDVTALTGDPLMLPLAVETGAAVCLMHMQGRPETMQDNPQYEDVVGEVYAYLQARRDAALAAGIPAERIALDPGIGFGKLLEHNLALLQNAWRLHELGCPVLVGPSRKRFIGQLLGDLEADRRWGTIGAALALARQGVQILRVHDVGIVRQALMVFEAAGGLNEPIFLARSPFRYM
ncbi:MAG: dihydropteroate synthase [Thermoguttaceae bacterium]|nr:dihydropteroate synthase [Thermoguttaceae bacterium]MDW8038298.1 dihydropteroate synthase [Thermoguttaceae bacterium]